MSKLFIDSSNNKEIVIKLELQGKMFSLKHIGDQRSSQMVLPLIDEILKQYDTKIESVSHVFVNTGPGSYTGLRVGIAVANAISFLLNVPVNDLPLGEMAVPNY